MAVFVLSFAFSQGVFPKPPDFAKLEAFDLSFLASHPKFTLFLLTATAVAVLVGFAVLSQRVKAFWARVRQGLTILRDRRRYLREVFAWQLARLVLSLHRVLVSARGVQRRRLGAQRAARARRQRDRGGLPVHARRRRNPAGAAGQGLQRGGVGGGRRRVLRRPADRHRRRDAGGGFGALVGIFRIRSFKEAIRMGKEEREAEKAAARDDAAAFADGSGPGRGRRAGAGGYCRP